jgi:peptidoglycan/LPS O-acetylase OafA/YrhL
VPLVLLTGTVTGAGVVAVVFYSANWWMLAGHDLGMLVHTWTLATEEQFYLLWPLVLLALTRLRRPLLAIVGLAVVPLLFTGSLSVLVSGDALLVGCGLAVWLHGKPTPRPLPSFAVPLCVAALVAACWIHAAPIYASSAATLASLGIVYGIATNSRAPLLASRLAEAVGRRSYGLYLWHLPALSIGLWVGVALGLNYWQAVTAGLPLMFGIVELSWRFVEQPFLRRRSADLGDRHGAVGRVEGTRGPADLQVGTFQVVADGDINVRGHGQHRERRRSEVALHAPAADH